MTKEVVVGTADGQADDVVAAINSSFELTIVEPERVPSDLTDRAVGAVLSKTDGSAWDVPTVLEELPRAVPTIVVADPTEISPERVFETGADAFVDSSGPGVRPRVRRRLEDVLETRTDPELPDRRDEFGALIENAPVPIGIIDAAGTITYANEATSSFVQAEESDAVEGEPVMSFAASETAETTRRRLQDVIENREPTPPMEQVFIDNEGNRRTAIVSTTPVTYQGEPAGQFVLNDITQYKRIQRELQHERDFVDRMLNTIEDVFFVVDEDGVFRRWNDTLLAVTGYSDSALRKASIDDIVHPDDHDAVAELTDPETQVDERVEIAIETADGELSPTKYAPFKRPTRRIRRLSVVSPET